MIIRMKIMTMIIIRIIIIGDSVITMVIITIIPIIMIVIMMIPMRTIVTIIITLILIVTIRRIMRIMILRMLRIIRKSYQFAGPWAHRRVRPGAGVCLKSSQTAKSGRPRALGGPTRWQAVAATSSQSPSRPWRPVICEIFFFSTHPRSSLKM